MFKFVQRRKDKKERDRDENDIEDEDDIDSEESESESESEDSRSEDSRLQEDADLGKEEDDEDYDGLPDITASDALSSPIQPDSSNTDDTSICMICPGKSLKTKSRMVEVHLASNSHKRRLKRFDTCIKELYNASESPSLIAVLLLMEKETAKIKPKERRPKEPAVPSTRKDGPSRREKKLAKKARRAAKNANTPISEPRVNISPVGSPSKTKKRQRDDGANKDSLPVPPSVPKKRRKSFARNEKPGGAD